VPDTQPAPGPKRKPRPEYLGKRKGKYLTSV
jgi:hypothetical protein